MLFDKLFNVKQSGKPNGGYKLYVCSKNQDLEHLATFVAHHFGP